MTPESKWRGGVVVAEGHHTHGLINLLAMPVRDRLELAYFPHAYQIETDQARDFVIVLSLDDLRNVIKFYDAKRQDLPLIVHIDEPATLKTVSHDVLFPGIDVLPVPQAHLGTEPGATLAINLFAEILNRLDKQSPPAARSPLAEE